MALLARLLTVPRLFTGPGDPAGSAGSDVEVVAVDDASPDDCGALLDRYAAADSRLCVLRLATNVRLGRARNAGLDAARGEYGWFVDGDDWLPDGALDAVPGPPCRCGPPPRHGRISG